MGKGRVKEWIRKNIHKKFTVAEILEAPHLLHEHIMVVEGMPGDWAVMTKLTGATTPTNYWLVVSNVDEDGAHLSSHKDAIVKHGIKRTAKEAQMLKVQFVRWLESIHLNRAPTKQQRVDALEEAAEKSLRKIDYLPD